MPELLPDVATAALKKVGIEVAVAGSTDEAAAASAASAAEAGSGITEAGAPAAAEAGAQGGGAAEAAAAVVTPDALLKIWEEEQQAWSMLLDGSGLSEHMEVGRGSAGRDWGA